MHTGRSLAVSFWLLASAVSTDCAAAQTESQPVTIQSSAPRAMPPSPVSCPSCDLHGRDFSGADLRGANLARANLSGANLSRADLSGAMLAGANLRDANLTNAKLGKMARAVSLDSADLTNADFTGASLQGASLQHAIVKGAKFGGADLSDAVFGPAIRSLEPASFANAIVSCDFPGALLAVDTSRQSGCAATASATLSAMACPNLATIPPNASYVSASKGADGPSCGEVTTPCASIQQGIANCGGSCNAVLVGYDVYDITSPIVPAAGVNLYGGCVWAGANATSSTSYYSKINPPPNGQPGFAINGVHSATTIQNFGVFATDASGASQPSVAFSIADSSSITLSYVTLIAGAGSHGAPGSNGTTGAKGGDGGPGKPENAGIGKCADTDGGTGGGPTTVTAVSGTCQALGCRNGYSGGRGTTGWRAGGSLLANYPSCGVCYSWPVTARPETPKPGDHGRSADCGSGGLASPNVTGGYAGFVWSAATGGPGQPGGNGGGGGGGGSGGYCGYFNFVSHFEGFTGQAGGGGGAGGCGASAGAGGQQGGPSIALQLVRSTAISTSNCTFTGGAGGAGGDGGKGGSGGAGGSGKSNPGRDICNETGGSGGTGGDGGSGGASGGGAGGNGGPSFVIVAIGCPAPALTTTDLITGGSGTAGNGGAGGVTASSCHGSQGKPGGSGAAVNVQTF